MPYQANTSFSSDGLSLAGHIMAPDTSNAYPAVLFLHGAGKSDKERYEFLQTYLCDLGYASLAFDFRGCGDSKGVFADGSLHNRLTDAINAYDYFASLPMVNRELITVAGSSMGGHIACRLTAHYPNIQSLILMAAAAYGKNTEDIPLTPQFTQAIHVPNNWKDSLSFLALEQFTQPILTIYGEHEDVIPREIQEQYMMYAQKNGTVHIIPDTDHKLLTAGNKVQEELSETIGLFLKST